MTRELKELKQKVRQGLKVTTHSKQVTPGCVFVVFEENKRYLHDAIKRGAKYIIMDPCCKDILVNIKEDVQVLFSLDIKKDFGELVAAYFGTEYQDFVLIGITGTNGKTTTSYLIEHLLKGVGMRVGVIGTINYRWLDKVEDSRLTTPGCLELHSIISKMRSDGIDVIIIEVSSHGLAQDRVSGLKFDFAIFTNLTQDHLDYHKNMEEYFLAKSKLFTSYLRKKGKGIINCEDEYGKRILDLLGNRAIGYGLKENCAYYNATTYLTGEIIDQSEGLLTLKCLYKQKEWKVSIPILGRHNALNLLAAQGVGLAMGLKPNVFEVFETLSQVPGRLEKVENPFGLDIFIDYAHTPDGLERVLMSIKELNYKRIILVFGCGGDRDKGKRSLMGEVACKYCDVIVITSDNPRGEEPEAIIKDILLGINNHSVIIEVDRREAIKKGLDLMEKGDALIIAGKGHETYQEIKGKRYPFNDREVVEEIINLWK